jgi:leader peptidase (prepilin peptidase)/N-methyltransferase
LATGIYSLLLLLIFRDKIFWAMSGNWWNWIEIFLQYFTLLLFIPLAVIDIKHYIIPDEITLSGIALALAASFLPDGITPLQSLVGAACGGGFLLLTGLVGKLILKREDAMGGGDIKFLLWLGALFGFEAAFVTIFAGCAVGAVVSIILILLKKAQKGKIIPFCPYLCVGALIFAAFGKEILSFF